MRNSTLCAALAALLLGAVSASAHHAFSNDFSPEKQVDLSGTVTRVQWTSPHVMTYIDVTDDQGKTTNWKVEMGSPTQLTKVGWTKTTPKVGEMVTLHGFQAKNGSHYANAEEMTMANGEKLSAVSSFDRAAAVPTSGSTKPKPVD